MDAYDIFKKLTNGLKFNTHILGAKDNRQKQPKNTLFCDRKVQVKKEKEELPDIDENEIITDCNDNLDESADESGNGDDNTEEEHNGIESNEEESDRELQLMEGVKVADKSKKKKKEKIMTEDKKTKLELEEQNRFRNEYGIRVVGRAVPPALYSFSALAENDKVAPHLRENLMQCGYTEPTPIQRQAMPCMLENRQILACAPTGSGKTAAFLLPILQSLGGPQGGPRALVLCPTRELAKQIYTEALRLSAGTNLRCNVISKITQNKMQEKQATLKKSDLVISTPNRLCFLLNQDGAGLSLDRIRWLIIDEADKLFEGSAEQESDFRRQLEQVMAACASRERRVAMFSATHTPAVAKWCRRNMRGLINITVGQRNAATELVQQELLFCGTESGKMVAFRQLVQQGLKPPVLVFVQSKDRAKQLFKELIYDGINVDAIHADRTQLQRDNVVKSFRLGKIWVLICTELMGRGIDFRGVNLVINYDFPPSAISYIHRIGRAGRAGQNGRAITFFTQDDVNLRSIAAVMKHSGCEVPEYMLTLKQNANARKQRSKKAPSRDQISTILTGTRRKRKHSSSDEKDTEVEGTLPIKKAFIKDNEKHGKSTKSKENFKKTKHGNIAKKNVPEKGSFKVQLKRKNYRKENNKKDFKIKKKSKVVKK